MPKKDLKEQVVKILEDSKIEDIIIIDTSKTSSLADYVIIGSGRSGKHIESSMDILKIELKKDGLVDGVINGKADDGWILYDLGNIIVHLFIPVIRDVYRLEELYSPNVKKTKDESAEVVKKNAKEKVILDKKLITKTTAVKKPTVKKTTKKMEK